MGQFAACHAALLCSSGSVLGQFRVCHVLVLDCHRVVRDGTAPLRSRPVQFCSVWYSRRSVPDSFRAIRVQNVLDFGPDGINSGPVPVLFRTILGRFRTMTGASADSSGQCMDSPRARAGELLKIFPIPENDNTK